MLMAGGNVMGQQWYIHATPNIARPVAPSSAFQPGAFPPPPWYKPSDDPFSPASGTKYFCMQPWNGVGTSPKYWVVFRPGALGDIGCLTTKSLRNVQIIDQPVLVGTDYILSISPKYGQIDYLIDKISKVEPGRLELSYRTDAQVVPCSVGESAVMFRYWFNRSFLSGYEGPSCVSLSLTNPVNYVYSANPVLGIPNPNEIAGDDQYRWFIEPNGNSGAPAVPLTATYQLPNTTTPLLASPDPYSRSITLNLNGATLPIRLGLVPGWCTNTSEIRPNVNNSYIINEAPSLFPSYLSFQTTVEPQSNPSAKTVCWGYLPLNPSATQICIPPTTYRYITVPGAGVQTQVVQDQPITTWISFPGNSNDYTYRITGFVGGNVRPTIVTNTVPVNGTTLSLTGNAVAVASANEVTSYTLNIQRPACTPNQPPQNLELQVNRVISLVPIGNGKVSGPANTPFFSTAGGTQAGSSPVNFALLVPGSSLPRVNGCNPAVPHCRPDGISRHRLSLNYPPPIATTIFDADFETDWRIELLNTAGVVVIDANNVQGSFLESTGAIANAGFMMALPPDASGATLHPNRNNARDIIIPYDLTRRYTNATQLRVSCVARNGCPNGPTYTYSIPPNNPSGVNSTDPFTVSDISADGWRVSQTPVNIIEENVRYSWYDVGTVNYAQAVLPTTFSQPSRTFSGVLNQISNTFAPTGFPGPPFNTTTFMYANPDFISDIGTTPFGIPYTGNWRKNGFDKQVVQVRTNPPQDLTVSGTHLDNTILATAELATTISGTCFLWAGITTSGSSARTADPKKEAKQIVVSHPVKLAKLVIDPNPASSRIRVKRLQIAPQNSKKINIMTLIVLSSSTGIQYLSESFSSEEAVLDIASLIPGSYHVVDMVSGASQQLIVK
jgi:hypothetical protein